MDEFLRGVLTKVIFSKSSHDFEHFHILSCLHISHSFEAILHWKVPLKTIFQPKIALKNHLPGYWSGLKGARNERIDTFFLEALYGHLSVQTQCCGYLKASPDLSEQTGVHFGSIEWIFVEFTCQENWLFKWRKLMKIQHFQKFENFM